MNTPKTALTRTQAAPVALLDEFDRKVVDVCRTSINRDLTDPELYLFLHCAKASGLDPRYKQIYAIKDNKGRLSITPSIDGMRLIAARTGRYTAGPVRYEYDAQGNPVSATSITYAFNREAGQWMGVEGVAWMKGSKRGSPQWDGDPMNMLGIAAERRSLKRAFPLDMTGLDVEDDFEDGVAAVARSNGPMVDVTVEPVEPVALPDTLGSGGVKFAKDIAGRAVALGLAMNTLTRERERLGMGKDPSAWTYEQAEALDSAIESIGHPAAKMPEPTVPASVAAVPPEAPPVEEPPPPPAACPTSDVLGPEGVEEEKRVKAYARGLGLRDQDFAGLRAAMGMKRTPADWTMDQVIKLEAAVREHAAGLSQ